MRLVGSLQDLKIFEAFNYMDICGVVYSKVFSRNASAYFKLDERIKGMKERFVLLRSEEGACA